MRNVFIDKPWLVNQAKKVRNNAGARYSPQLNVDLPISEVFDAICRTTEFYNRIRIHLGDFNRACHSIPPQYQDKSLQNQYDNYINEAKALSAELAKIKEYDVKPIPWKLIGKRTKRVIKITWSFSDNLRDTKEKLDKTSVRKDTDRSIEERLSSAIHYLYKAQRELNSLEEYSKTSSAELSNKPHLLLEGLAGNGKTHLLCDVLENHINRDSSLPAVLVFSEFFTGNDKPWEQIINQLSLSYTKDQFLNLLNNAGIKSKSRALLVIDALNETRNRNFWKKNLDQILNDVKKYPHIALAVSIRSGFEREVMKVSQQKSFVRVIHTGFEFREWEAVSKFFQEFNLPFPEIPLLTPEFQNPLFLLLFCKAFQERAKKNKGKNVKEIFRGHEGATYIFESFVDSISERIAKKFKLIGTNKNIWDNLIEKVAEEMIKTSDDRIPESRFMNLVKKSYPAINCSEFIKELERNLLIVKVPSYDQKSKAYNGFDYRFPFQKFSDHLLGRYLFKKYELEFGKGNKNLGDIKRFFSKRRKLGKYLSNSWNRGLIEALSIQCPERFNGYELINVAPFLTGMDAVQEAFVESLIWRRPTAFSSNLQNAKDYINNYIIRSEYGHINLLNAFLSVAPIPNHPFNADFLHTHLSRFSMAARDSWWSTFLHRQVGYKGTVDRLVEWAWSEQDRSKINDDSLRLCAVALIWFLTTSNRILRDKSTKALVSILTNKLSVVLSLLKQFENVNDPYVSERLYAVAYGCAIRTHNREADLKELAIWVYKTHFSKRNPPVDILTRDYARGVIEVAIYQKVPMVIDRQKLIPPFKSTWPKIVPSEKTLRKKYYPEDFLKDRTKNRGFLDIWSSVMYSFGSLADFGNYILDSAVNHWSGRKLKGDETNRKLLFETFKKNLRKDQRELLEQATNPFYGIDFTDLYKNIKFTSHSDNAVDEEKIKKEEEDQKKRMDDLLIKFETSLSYAKRKIFDLEIKPFLDSRGGINDPLERFDTKLAQRWVFNRVVQLGWKFSLHGEFDGTISYSQTDRSDHKVERIGKKYQWIALHELLARIADNFEFKEESWSHHATKYNGPWQLNVRDIDPSCILKDPPNNTPDNLPSFTNHLKLMDYHAWNKEISDSKWLKKDRDLPGPEKLIDLVDDNGVSWLLLEGFIEWQEETPPEEKKYDLPTRTLWYMLKSYLVKKKNSDEVFEWAKDKDFMGRWMPESHEFYDIFLGEFPWAPSFIDHYVPYYHHDEWTENARDKKIPHKILVTDDEYLSSGSSTDSSTDHSIGIKLPAKWVVDKMNLVQDNVDGRFFDEEGNLVAFDPHIFNPNIGRSLLIQKERFNKFLKQKGYSVFWTFLSEKNLMGGRDYGRSSGRLELTGAYLLNEKNKIEGVMRSKFLNFKDKKNK